MLTSLFKRRLMKRFDYCLGLCSICYVDYELFIIAKWILFRDFKHNKIENYKSKLWTELCQDFKPSIWLKYLKQMLFILIIYTTRIENFHINCFYTSFIFRKFKSLTSEFSVAGKIDNKCKNKFYTAQFRHSTFKVI